MTNILINYADGAFRRAQDLNAKTGLSVGGFDRVIPYGPQHLDAEFRVRNHAVLSHARGAGCWLWKPYLMVATLRDAMSDGDVLFYADSGSHFVGSAAPVIDLCKRRRDKPILLFTLSKVHTNRRWTKRDCFYYLGLDGPPYIDLPQLLGTFIVCQKHPYTLAFFEQWLRYAEDPRVITDDPNQCGLPDYPEFEAHRHDQSILSLLARKHAIPNLPDISQWGNDERPREFQQVLLHRRWRE